MFILQCVTPKVGGGVTKFKFYAARRNDAFDEFGGRYVVSGRTYFTDRFRVAKEMR